MSKCVSLGQCSFTMVVSTLLTIEEIRIQRSSLPPRLRPLRDAMLDGVGELLVGLGEERHLGKSRGARGGGGGKKEEEGQQKGRERGEEGRTLKGGRRRGRRREWL